MKLMTHLHLVHAKITNAILPLPQYAFMVWCLVKAQGLYLCLEEIGCEIVALVIAVMNLQVL
jgi:hypothetical protein